LVLLLIFVGLLIGTGVLVLDKFSRASRDTTTTTDASLNLSVAGTTTLAKTYCIAVKSIVNWTTSFSLTDYGVNFTNADTCTIQYAAISGCKTNLCNVTYTWGADTSSAASTLNSAYGAISPIATTYMGLIVTIAVLAVVLGLVMGSFGGRQE
jgi:hypothetical protein